MTAKTSGVDGRRAARSTEANTAALSEIVPRKRLQEERDDERGDGVVAPRACERAKQRREREQPADEQRELPRLGEEGGVEAGERLAPGVASQHPALSSPAGEQQQELECDERPGRQPSIVGVDEEDAEDGDCAHLARHDGAVHHEPLEGEWNLVDIGEDRCEVRPLVGVIVRERLLLVEDLAPRSGVRASCLVQHVKRCTNARGLLPATVVAYGL
eukprot:739620-Prymnesium_polylepis.1